MTSKKIRVGMSVIALGTIALAAVPAFAEDNASVAVSATTSVRIDDKNPGIGHKNLLRVEHATTTLEREHASSTQRRATSTGQRMEKREEMKDKIEDRAKTRGIQEIDRRIEALHRLLDRLTGAKRVATTTKDSITASLQTQITSLTALKANIASTTATTTLKADIESITKSYRIFALVMPQSAVLAAADRVNVTADMMTAVGGKLSTRIVAAQTAGKDVSALQTLLSHYTSQIAAARTEAAAAVSGIANLTPDNGDKAKMQANTNALIAARAHIKSAIADLKSAREDSQKIIKTLKSFGIGVTATSTATTSASAH